MTSSQCRAARGLLNISQTQLAKAAGVGLSTIVDTEKDRRPLAPKTLQSIRTALENAGIIFIQENGEGPGVRLRKPK